MKRTLDDAKTPAKKKLKKDVKSRRKVTANRSSRAVSAKSKVKSTGTDKNKRGKNKSTHSTERPRDEKRETPVEGKQKSQVKRNKKGQLLFEDFPDFGPNMTPKEVLQAGSFGGTYFRPIYSSITKQNYKNVWQELPKDWLKGLDISTQVASSTYRADVNRYKVKCGGSLQMWEEHGWIVPQDPYGWFQWFCRFYQGRRTADDARQVSRWVKCAGVRGRWRNNLITKVVGSGSAYNSLSVSPVVRQTLQHWAYTLTLQDFQAGARRVKAK